MKKLIILMMCAVLVFSTAACKKENADTPEKANIKAEDSVNTESKSENEEESGTEKKTSDDEKIASDENSEEEAMSDTTEAPVIESTEELETMVDEFNTTDDPVKKEELRKKLEAFLEQAEQQAAAE